MLKLSTNFGVFYLKQLRIIWISTHGGLKYHLIIISMRSTVILLDTGTSGISRKS